MTVDYYQGHSTYVIYAEDTAWGTSGTPSVSNAITKVQNVSFTMTNNFLRAQGLGDGRNATVAVPSGFDVTGRGPGSDLYLVTINWTTEGIGTTDITIEVDTLVDPNYLTIGTPAGIGNTVTVN